MDWWITTEFFDNGGQKVMGPFVSRDLAMEVRRFREAFEHHSAYFIDSEAAETTKAAPPDHRSGGAAHPPVAGA